MNTIIPTWIFYAISVAEHLKGVLIILFVFFLIFSIILAARVLIMISDNYKDENEFLTIKGFFKKCATITLAAIILNSFIPSEKTMYTMIANNFITHDNVENFKGDAKELTDYVFEKIEDLKSEEK